MTLLTDKHTCKDIQIQRQILGKNFTSWVNSGRRTQEDKDKQMKYKYTRRQGQTNEIQMHIFQVRTLPHG